MAIHRAFVMLSTCGTYRTVHGAGRQVDCGVIVLSPVHTGGFIVVSYKRVVTVLPTHVTWVTVASLSW